MAEEGSLLGLLFEISADPSKAITATESFRGQASSALREFENQMVETMTHSIGISKEFAIGMGVAVGAVTGLAIAMFELAHKAAEVGGKIYELGEKTQMSAETLSGIMAVTKQTGESFDSLATAISRSSINIQKIIDAGPEHHSTLVRIIGGYKELQEIGLKPTDERFQEIIHRIFEMNDIGERNRALQELMGRGWMSNYSSLQLLAEKGYGPAIEKAKQLGVYFDNESAAKARQFELAWTDIQNRFAAVAQIAGVQLLPVMSALLRNIVTMVEYYSQFSGVIAAIFRPDQPMRMVQALKEVNAHYKGVLEIMAEVEKRTESLATVQTASTSKMEAQAKDMTKIVANIIKQNQSELLRDTQQNLDNLTQFHLSVTSKLLDTQEKYLKDSDTLWKETGALYTKVQNEMAASATRVNEDLAKSMEEYAHTQTRAILKEFDEGKKFAEQRKKEIDSIRKDLAHQEEADIQRRVSMYHQFASIASDAFSHLSGSAGRWANLTVKATEEVVTAIIQKDMVEKQSLITIAALKAYHEAAEAFAAAARYDFWSAAQHTAAAAAYGLLAAAPIASAFFSGGGGGGGKSSGGGGGSFGDAGASGGGGGFSPAMSTAGGGGTGRGMRVIVMGEHDTAQEFARMLNQGVRHSGVQLLATGVKT